MVEELKAVIAGLDHPPVTIDDGQSLVKSHVESYCNAAAFLRDHGQALVEAVESENARIGAFVRRIEREGASNLHQSMAQAFIRHALSGEHDSTEQTVPTP